MKSATRRARSRQAEENLKLVAEATGTEDKATEAIAAFDAAVAKGKAALEDAGLAGKRVAFADGWVADGKVSIRPFAEGSLLTDINTELGLVSPWEMEGDAAYGLATTDVEGLTAVDAEHFVYITNGADGTSPSPSPTTPSGSRCPSWSPATCTASRTASGCSAAPPR